MELQEVWLCLFDQRLVVVVANRQTPGAVELEVAAGHQIVLQVALEEERAFFNVALHGAAQQLRQVVRLQTAAGDFTATSASVKPSPLAMWRVATGTLPGSPPGSSAHR